MHLRDVRCRKIMILIFEGEIIDATEKKCHDGNHQKMMIPESVLIPNQQILLTFKNKGGYRKFLGMLS